jgi:hypothetical protein
LIPAERQVWQIAAALISRQSGSAAAYAETQARRALDKSDQVAHAVWMAVRSAVLALQRSRDDDESLN